MKWTATFRGRRQGALGLPSWFKVEVESDTRDSARLALYEQGYEHIEMLALQPVETPVCEKHGGPIVGLCVTCGHAWLDHKWEGQ